MITDISDGRVSVTSASDPPRSRSASPGTVLCGNDQEMKMRIYLYIICGIILFSQTGCIREKGTEAVAADHPEKLYPYEVTYDAAEYRERRDRLVNELPGNAMALVVTNDHYNRNGSVDYEFRPASNFYYLTGFDEAHAAAIIRKKEKIL